MMFNRLSAFLSLTFSCILTSSSAAPTYTPILPPSYPIAVRNPYLSAWLPGNQTANLPSATPQFWSGANLTLGVLARVDGTTYSLLGALGNGAEAASVVSADFTHTHTTFDLLAGAANVTLDFFSPVSPANYVRQSLPFSYLTVSASSANGSSVQVYVDIDETWTGQSGATASNFTTSGSASVYQLSVNGATLYTESEMMQALWGEAVLAAPSDNSTAQLGDPATVRGQFATNGSLSGDQPTYAAGNVIAFAQDLGSVSDASSATFAIGYAREEAVNYLGNARAGYYRATYSDTPSAAAGFLDDYAAANTESQSMDSTLQSKATAAGGSNYSTIVTLSTRQTYGGLDVTIPEDTLDTSDVMVFLKEISSDGNVNTMDVIFPAFPAFYVMDPEYIRLLLEPVVQYLASGRWQQPFVIHDIGTNYPNATGHDDQMEEDQPIEETGNLLILAYAYQKASGNTSFTDTYTSLFQGYADYLVANGLNISSQLSTDDGAGPLPNQTNLAIKAAIGLTAFGNMTGMDNYTAVGLNYSDQLYNQGLGTDPNKTHFTLEYGNFSTYTTAFNLYPDTLLGLNTFPAAAFEMESAFYPTVRAQTGIPLDTRVDWGKSDWYIYAAASATDSSTTNMFIDDVYGFISNGLNAVPFSDRFFVSDSMGDTPGLFDDFEARPVVGGEFAILALQGSDIVTESSYTS